MTRFFLYIFTGLLACSQSAMAQALTNNNAIITVNPDTRMTIDGGVLNNGDLVNHGTISVTGDWMNVDTYTPSTGRLIFNGAQEQHIAHNHGQVFKLDMEGGGNKTITSAIEIQDTLNFIDGVVSVESGVSLLVQSNGAVVGGSDLSYVDGTLSHQGTGYKYFPVGTNNHFRPAELVNVSGNNPVVGISVHEPNADPVIPLQLLTISDTRFWQLTHQSGVYDGSQIRLKVEADENLSSDIDLQDVVVAKADSVGGVFLTLGQSLYSGSLQDGEVTSMLPATEGFLAIAVEGFAEERALFVPNALSPAAPNPEDQVIKVYGQQIVDEGFMFRIYNRWGHLVYETDSFVEANTVGWRGGSTNGELESVGVYQYTLTGRFASGKPFKRQGNIKVIR